MIQKIDHIGIAVADLQAAIEKYQAIFQKHPDLLEEVESQQVRVAMFKAGESSIELLEGTAPTSAITRFVETRGEGIHHICLSVESLQKALEVLEEADFEIIRPADARGAGGSHIAFLHPKSTGGVLIELVEK
ncbi:MAG: methylmalonyl-CoA epimerase [Calditrichaeota bacterium]|nr:MAG: methylmalonyl-CoA epimerase [Calditrichota bacterium]